MQMNQYYVYILRNKTKSVLYIGVTDNLQRRIYEHKNEVLEGFTKKYHVHYLIYFETYQNISDAIAREKQLKGWLRIKKEQLIASMNPLWNDLSEEW